MATPRTVLLVEDDDDLREAIAVTLDRHGYTVIACADGAEAEEVILDQLPDLTIVEMMLAGNSGFQVSRLVKERSEGRAPVIMTAWFASSAHRDYALADGADAFFRKPFALADLTKIATTLCPPVRPGSGSRAIPNPAPVRS